MRGKVEDHGHLIRMMCRSCHAPLRTDKQSTVFIASLRYLDVDVFLYILYSKLILWLCSSFPRRAHTRCSPPHVAVIQHNVRAAHQYIIRAQRNRLGLRVAAKRDSWKAAGSLPFKPSFADAADFWPRRTGRRLIGCPVPLSPRSRCASKTCRPCRSSFRLLPGDWQRRRKTGPKTSSTCSFFWFASRPSLLETRTRQNRQPALAICPTRPVPFMALLFTSDAPLPILMSPSKINPALWRLLAPCPSQIRKSRIVDKHWGSLFVCWLERDEVTTTRGPGGTYFFETRAHITRVEKVVALKAEGEQTS